MKKNYLRYINNLFLKFEFYELGYTLHFEIKIKTTLT